MSGSLPVRSRRRCQRKKSHKRKRPAMMNQIVNERQRGRAPHFSVGAIPIQTT